MRVALTGVSGFIGSHIARDLHKAGHLVTALVRSTSRCDHVAAWVDRFVEGEQADETCWPRLLDGAECVIHNSVDWEAIQRGDQHRHLHSNLLGSIRLLHASAPRQFVFISTIAVHHDMRPRWNGIIDEDHPLRPAGWYGAYKAAVEDHLWAAHFESGRHVCALRPCGVYGVDPQLQRSQGYDLLKKLMRGERTLNKPGGGKFVHVDDVAAAVVATIGGSPALRAGSSRGSDGSPARRAGSTPGSENRGTNAMVYNLVDCYARWADWAQMAADIMGVKAQIDFSSPVQPKNTFTKDAAKSLGINLDRGHDGIRAHLGQLKELMMRDGSP